MPLRVEPRRDRKLHRLVKAAEIRAVRRGEVLYRAGEAAGDVWLVRSGFFRLLDPSTASARPRTVAVAGPWEVMGEEAVGKGGRRYTCVAGEAATCQALDGEGVLGALGSSVRTALAAVEASAGDLACVRRLACDTALTAEGRLAVMLLELARRWGEPHGTGVLVPHRLTHQVLADLSGVHRSTVTATLGDWLYRGLVEEAPRALLVALPERLRSLAERPSGSRGRR